MNDLTIHAGTVVCPLHGSSTPAEGCATCDAYRGLGRANASVVCLPPASVGSDPKLLSKKLVVIKSV